LTDTGNVIAIYKNEKDITAEEVEISCDFSQNVIASSFEEIL